MLLLIALQAEAADALRQTRAEKSYEVTFTSSLAIGRGDPLDRKGTVRWWKAGVILVDSTGSGQEIVRAVRAGTLFACGKHDPSFKSTPCESCGPRRPTAAPRVWVTHLGRWTPKDEAGNTTAATGFQNPDELLRLIETQAHLARPKKGDWEIVLKGQDALDVANMLEPQRKFVGQSAAMSVLLKLRQGRVAALEVDASAATAEGAGTFKASAQLGQFGQAAVPAALGAVPFSADIAAAIAEQLK